VRNSIGIKNFVNAEAPQAQPHCARRARSAL
jgi:hypothetical protein